MNAQGPWEDLSELMAAAWERSGEEFSERGRPCVRSRPKCPPSPLTGHVPTLTVDGGPEHVLTLPSPSSALRKVLKGPPSLLLVGATIPHPPKVTKSGLEAGEEPGSFALEWLRLRGTSS